MTQTAKLQRCVAPLNYARRNSFRVCFKASKPSLDQIKQTPISEQVSMDSSAFVRSSLVSNIEFSNAEMNLEMNKMMEDIDDIDVGADVGMSLMLRT